MRPLFALSRVTYRHGFLLSGRARRARPAMRYFELALYLIGVLGVVITVLPLWPSRLWWVRICDFPRFQIAVGLTAVLFLVPLVSWPLSVPQVLFLIVVASAVAWQMSWVWRYLPLAPKEVESSKATTRAPQTLSLLTTNVLQTSRKYSGLVEIIRKSNPDLILAVETDEWWCARLLEALAHDYPHRMLYPLSNGYGMALFSRLELIEPGIRFVVDDAIPSIRTKVQLRTGAQIDLYGMHPRPPAPAQDTTQRDVELVLIGDEIQRLNRPAIVLGDLNDVAWSPTTSSFKSAGKLLDPRRGRGFFNTYPAGLPGLRYPLDYVFHSTHFAIGSMEVLPAFGSDHLPLAVTLELKPFA